MSHVAQRPPKLSHSIIVRAPGLLPMLYSPPELEAELGLPARYIRDWLEIHAIPHHRDANGFIWINGREFAAWVVRVRAARRLKTTPLAVGQAFCLRCRRAVDLVDPTTMQRGKVRYWCGVCPHCGLALRRGERHG
jgi:hypothetical protein